MPRDTLAVIGSRPPDVAEDAFTRIWHRADASHGQYVQAITELRERKRREQGAPQLERRRGRRTRGVPHPGVRARQRPDDLRAAMLVASVEHPLCPRCSQEVRRLLAGKEPLTAPHHREEQQIPLAFPARAGWFLLRMGAYGLIGLAVFAFVAWASAH
jgi:hypothetical protein